MRVVLGFVVVFLVGPADAAPVPSPLASEELIGRLVAALSDPDADVRFNLAHALAKIGPPSVEPLQKALKDADASRRAGAAYSLGLIGQPARTAMPALLDALTDSDVEVRRQVSFAIGRLIPARSASTDVLGKASAAPAGGKP